MNTPTGQHVQVAKGRVVMLQVLALSFDTAGRWILVLLGLAFLLVGCNIRSDGFAAMGLDGGAVLYSDSGAEGAIVVAPLDVSKETAVAILDSKSPPDAVRAIEVPTIDLQPGTACMSQVIANGYASPDASCSNPPSGFSASARFASIEAACRWEIDCFAANNCKHSMSVGNCSDCSVDVWVTKVATPLIWLGQIILPYCPEFYLGGLD